MPTKSSKIEIVRLSKAHPKVYFTNIAALHIKQIHHGLLPLLGLKTLTRLYYELVISHETGVWAELKSNELVGFISGCADARLTYFSVLSRAWPLFLSLAPEVIVRPGLLKQMVSVLYYPFVRSSMTRHYSEACSSIKSEILAIAVSMDMEGRGIGGKLVQTFEEELLRWKNKGYYRVATNMLDIKSNYFYRKVGCLPCHQIKHNDLILQVYLKDIKR